MAAAAAAADAASTTAAAEDEMRVWADTIQRLATYDALACVAAAQPQPALTAALRGTVHAAADAMLAARAAAAAPLRALSLRDAVETLWQDHTSGSGSGSGGGSGGSGGGGGSGLTAACLDGFALLSSLRRATAAGGGGGGARVAAAVHAALDAAVDTLVATRRFSWAVLGHAAVARVVAALVAQWEVSRAAALAADARGGGSGSGGGSGAIDGSDSSDEDDGASARSSRRARRGAAYDFVKRSGVAIAAARQHLQRGATLTTAALAALAKDAGARNVVAALSLALHVALDDAVDALFPSPRRAFLGAPAALREARAWDDGGGARGSCHPATLNAPRASGGALPPPRAFLYTEGRGGEAHARLCFDGETLARGGGLLVPLPGWLGAPGTDAATAHYLRADMDSGCADVLRVSAGGDRSGRGGGALLVTLLYSFLLDAPDAADSNDGGGGGGGGGGDDDGATATDAEGGGGGGGHVDGSARAAAAAAAVVAAAAACGADAGAAGAAIGSAGGGAGGGGAGGGGSGARSRTKRDGGSKRPDDDARSVASSCRRPVGITAAAAAAAAAPAAAAAAAAASPQPARAPIAWLDAQRTFDGTLLVAWGGRNALTGSAAWAFHIGFDEEALLEGRDPFVDVDDAAVDDMYVARYMEGERPDFRNHGNLLAAEVRYTEVDDGDDAASVAAAAAGAVHFEPTTDVAYDTTLLASLPAVAARAVWGTAHKAVVWTGSGAAVAVEFASGRATTVTVPVARHLTAIAPWLPPLPSPST